MIEESDLETKIEAAKQELEKHLSERGEFSAMARQRINDDNIKAIQLQSKWETLKGLITPK